MTLLFLIGDIKTAATVFFLLMWLAHYVHRAFIYPFQNCCDADCPYPNSRCQGSALSASQDVLLTEADLPGFRQAGETEAAGTGTTQTRAEKLCRELERALTPEQVRAIQLRAQGQTLSAVVQPLLSG